MVAITQYTDDFAFFSAELADELQVHAVRVRQKLLKFAKDVPKATTVDFSGPRASGLLPPRENYEAWLAGFKSQDSSVRSNNAFKPKPLRSAQHMAGTACHVI